MSIKEKHLLRTQKLTLIVFSIITLFSFLGIMAQKANAGLPEWQNNTPLALVLLAYVSSFVVYKKNRGKEFYGRFVMIVYLVAYASMLLISASNTTYPYMIALLITIVISLDKTAVRIGTIGFVVINVLKVVMMLASAAVPTDVLENVMVETIITVLIAISCFMGRKILEQLLNESTDEIQSAADKQAELTASVLASIKRIEVENDSNVNAVEAIAVSAETINSAMNDIAAGTVDTADAIQKQNTMTQDITEIIEETGTKTGAVTEMTKATMEALAVGTEAMSTLVSAVEAAITSGAAMKESAEKLESKTDEVKEITSIILNISGQTNLLALNASIEAARAGEAGRGFAVVADEIRKLAEQTKSATENIADILEELVADARTVSQKVDENVELSNEENEMAEKANAEFAQIKELVEDMTGQIGEVSEMMGRLSEANDVISENVTTLSASSEEISASAENTFDESKKNVAMVSEFKASMEAIAAEVRKLAELA